MRLINTEMLANPLNWLTVLLMLIIFVIFVGVVGEMWKVSASRPQ